MTVTKLTRDEARTFMVGHHGLCAMRTEPTPEARLRALVNALRCIQLDPLDVLGTNADLIAIARIDGIRKGDVYTKLMPGHAFEHWAKQRCILPASAFPYYRSQEITHDYSSQAERLARLHEGVVERVYAAVKAHGPVTSADLEEHGEWGAVEAFDYSGWQGTSKAQSMALDVLWAQCRLVVAGRTTRGKLWDVPSRALGAWARKRAKPASEFARWALIERVEAAGLLARASGPHWSMLTEARTSGLPDALIGESVLEEVEVEGLRGKYLAPAGFRDRTHADDDGRMRILGPLDALLWDRKLVAAAFGFEYVWEVYKPAHTRKYGWYVVPLLHRGELVGRMEARVEGRSLVVHNLWTEPARGGRRFDRRAFRATIERHADCLWLEGYSIPK